VKGLDPRLRLVTLALLVGTAFLVIALSGSLSALGGSLGNLRSPEAIAAVVVLVGMALVGLALARPDLRRARRVS
jgi:hypothetical protein